MTEIIESICPPKIAKPEKTPEEKKKTPVKIRISLFFDGTLNNRRNIEAREQGEKEYVKHTKSGSSFENGRTNIAIMEPHLKEGEGAAKGYDYAFKSYIEGQGTFSLKSDSKKGYAFAIGQSGVPGRAKLGVSRALNAIYNNKKFNSSEHYIEKLSIDVFGFSRGAATARYAIHLLLKGNKPIYSRLQKLGISIEESAVEVKFSGLYDSVLSYIASQKFKSSSNWLEQKSVKHAKKVLHLASAEEHRKDFPLHNIKSAGGKGKEYFLPGVHSDIGGSYNKASEAALKTAKQKGEKEEYMLMNNEGMTVNSGYVKTALKKDREYLIKQGWYTASELTLHTEEAPLAQEGGTDWSYLFAIRDNIHSAYANIPLKIMAKTARGTDVKLTISKKLERRADKVIAYSDQKSKTSELKDLENYINSYIGSTSSSKPEDWLTGAHNEHLKSIRHRHLNFSSAMELGYKPRFSKKQRKRYIYDA